MHNQTGWKAVGCHCPHRYPNAIKLPFFFFLPFVFIFSAQIQMWSHSCLDACKKFCCGIQLALTHLRNVGIENK